MMDGGKAHISMRWHSISLEYPYEAFVYTGNIGYLDSIRNAGTDFTITNCIVSQVLPGFYWLLEVGCFDIRRDYILSFRFTVEYLLIGSMKLVSCGIVTKQHKSNDIRCPFVFAASSTTQDDREDIAYAGFLISP